MLDLHEEQACLEDPERPEGLPDLRQAIKEAAAETAEAMKTKITLEESLLASLQEAERKAWIELGRYKFVMFGYWAGIWVHLNRISNLRRPNPWKGLVKHARVVLRTAEKMKI